MARINKKKLSKGMCMMLFRLYLAAALVATGVIMSIAKWILGDSFPCLLK